MAILPHLCHAEAGGGGMNEDLEKSQEIPTEFPQHALIGGLIGGRVACQHCFCGRESVNMKDHLVCCMCSTRTLAHPFAH